MERSELRFTASYGVRNYAGHFKLTEQRGRYKRQGNIEKSSSAILRSILYKPRWVYAHFLLSVPRRSYNAYRLPNLVVVNILNPPRRSLILLLTWVKLLRTNYMHTQSTTRPKL